MHDASTPGPDTDRPGDVRPRSAGLLERPPGERFAPSPAPHPVQVDPVPGRVLAFGVAGAMLVAVAWLVLAGVLGLDWGMLVAAVAGGWGVGMLVARGAWSAEPHRPRASLRILAGTLAVAGWIGGQAAVYLWTRVTLPGSELDVGARIAATPFTAYLGDILGPLDAIDVLALAVVACVAAR